MAESAPANNGWVCQGCGKHVIGTIPVGPCTDCGGRWTRATAEMLACDRCGAADASRVFNSGHARLCEDCIDHENRDNPQCPECGRRLLPNGPGRWECPECWEAVESAERLDCPVCGGAVVHLGECDGADRSDGPDIEEGLINE